jgi:chaperonin GroES
MSEVESIRPLGNRVLVKREKVASAKGKILLPPGSQEKPKEGVVVSVGPGKLDDEGRCHPINLKEGDRVLFTSYGGTEVTLNNEEYLMMREEDILALLT